MEDEWDCRGATSDVHLKGWCPSGGSLPRAWSGRNGLPSPATGTWKMSPSTPPQAPSHRKKAYFKAYYKRSAAARKAAGLLKQEKAAASNSEALKQEDEVDQPASQCQVEEADGNIDAENSPAFGSTSGETEQSAVGEIAQDHVSKEVVEADGGEKKAEEAEIVASDQSSASAQTTEDSLVEVVSTMEEDIMVIEDDCEHAVKNSVAIDPLEKPQPTQELVVEVHKLNIVSMKEKRPMLSVLRCFIRRITSKLLSLLPTPTLHIPSFPRDP